MRTLVVFLSALAALSAISATFVNSLIEDAIAVSSTLGYDVKLYRPEGDSTGLLTFPTLQD